MAEGQDATLASEPSMEEILASIRKIIADDDAPQDANAAGAPATATGEDVLELTQLVEEDGSVVDLKEKTEVEPEAEAPAPVVEEPDFAPVAAAPAPEPSPVPPPAAAPVPDPTLVSAQAEKAATSSLATLASMVQMERMASQVPVGTPLGNGVRTLEDMVTELMRPMLKEWLDQNLPAVVDRLVQKEIERIVRHKDD